MANQTKEKLYAVSFISFFDNELRTTFQITDKGKIDALHKGMQKIFPDKSDKDMLDSFRECKTLEEAKQLAFDQDSMLHVEKYSRSKAE